jgi:hypothetical protein
VIDRVDEDIRGQLARLAPGAPEGRVDMDSLRQQIADLSARKEIGVKSSITQDRLELTTGAQGNRTDRERGAIVAVSIVFAMIMLMIAKEGHGPSPVLAIIMTAFLVRFFLRVATLRRSNRIVLEGRKLRVFGMLGSRDYQLGPQSRAYAGTSLVPSQNGNPYYRAAILMLDANGSEISIPVMQAPAFQEELVRKINAYLAAQAP